MLQADRILPEKRKVKKFLCTNSFLELVTCYCKRSQRSVVSERRIRARQHKTFWEKFIIKYSLLVLMILLVVNEFLREVDASLNIRRSLQIRRSNVSPDALQQLDRENSLNVMIVEKQN